MSKLNHSCEWSVVVSKNGSARCILTDYEKCGPEEMLVESHLLFMDAYDLKEHLNVGKVPVYYG